MVEPVGAVGSLPPGGRRAVRRGQPDRAHARPPTRSCGRYRPGRRRTVCSSRRARRTRPIEGWAAYCAAKAGGEMFFRVLAAERPDLRVVNVNPGRMDTGMQGVLRRSEFPSRQSLRRRARAGRAAPIRPTSPPGSSTRHLGSPHYRASRAAARILSNSPRWELGMTATRTPGHPCRRRRAGLDQPGHRRGGRPASRSLRPTTWQRPSTRARDGAGVVGRARASPAGAARLLRFRAVLARRIEELAALMRARGRQARGRRRGRDRPAPSTTCTGRPAMPGGCCGRAGSRSARLQLEFAARVEYQPHGVVGVIGPWNYPVFTPLGSIGYALAAGNAVVYKPSEYTPAVGQWLVDRFAEVVPEQPVLQIVHGLGETGAALCRSRRRQDRVHRVDGDRQEGHGRLRRDADAGAGGVRRQGRDDRRQPTPTSRGRRRGAAGAGSTTPGRRASASSGCTWCRRWPTTFVDELVGQAGEAEGRLRRRLRRRADHDAGADRDHPPAHRRRGRRRRHGRAGRARRGAAAVRAPDDPGRRAGDQLRRCARRRSGRCSW